MPKAVIASAVVLSGTAVLAQDTGNLTQAPPPAPCQAVSELVELPEFMPGLGQLFVDPATLPPHEMAGMVGRVVVGHPRDTGWEDLPSEGGDLPQAALAAFPPVEEILAAGRIDAESPT